MAIVPFKYYLHDESTHHEMLGDIGAQVGLSEDEMEALDVGRPFYEITLECALDTETGEIWILDMDQRA